MTEKRIVVRLLKAWSFYKLGVLFTEPVNLKLQLLRKGEEGELYMTGRLDSSTTADAEEIMLKLVDEFNALVLNMQNLKYISSSGLRILKQMYIKTIKQEKTLQIKGANNFIMETFQMTGFAGILTFV